MTDLGYIAKFGSSGAGNTNLSGPFGFATDGKFIWIADTGNDRIVKRLLAGGGYISQIGSSGSGNNNFNNPKDIELHEGLLFVCDTANDRVKIHKASDLSYVGEFGSSGSGNSNLDAPVSICSDGEFFYISDGNNSRVVKWDIKTLSYSAKTTAALSSPQQVCYDRDARVIWVVDAGNTRVRKFRASNLTLIDSLVAADSIDASLAGLTGIAVKNHYAYLTEANRIQVFDTTNTASIDTAGSDGSGNTNIADGNYIKCFGDVVIFSDASNDRINIWQSYKVARGFSGGDAFTIQGAFYSNPMIAIGGKQERQNVTIGGSVRKDKVIWLEEDPPNNKLAWTEET